MERAAVSLPLVLASTPATWSVSTWHAAAGATVLHHAPLATLRASTGAEYELVAPRSGVLRAVHVPASAQVDPPTRLLAEIEYCPHAVVFNGLCAVCGEEETRFAPPYMQPRARLPVAYSAALSVSRTEAHTVSARAARRLFEARQLSLVLDLDHTLVHTTDDPRAAEVLKHSPAGVDTASVEVFVLPSSRGGLRFPHVMHLKLRPNLRPFLERVRVKFNLHIYTMGSRLYADRVAKLIDPDNRFFGGRITSREDFPEGNCNQKNIQRLFPCDDSMALIVDDREDVWLSDSTQPYMPNLLRAQPYHFWVGMHEAYDRVAPPQPDVSQQHHQTQAADALPGQAPANQYPSKAVPDPANNLDQPSAKQNSLITNSDTGLGHQHNASTAPVQKATPDESQSPRLLEMQHQQTKATAIENENDTAEPSTASVNNGPSANPAAAVQKTSPQPKPSSAEAPASHPLHSRTSPSGLPAKDVSATTTESNGTCPHDPEAKQKTEHTDDSPVPSVPKNKAEKDPVKATNTNKLRSIAKGWWETDASPKSTNHLLRLAQVLEDCHTEFFNRSESLKAHNGIEETSSGKQFQAPADVKEILSEFRKKVLAGCVLTFSGLKPKQDAPDTVPEWNLALRLGASCSSEFVRGRTTHVVTSVKRPPDTQKCMDAMLSGTAYVVTTDWVEDCALNFERQHELAYCESAQQMFDDPNKFRDYVEQRHKKAAEALRKRGRDELDEIYKKEVIGTIPWKRARTSGEVLARDQTEADEKNSAAAVRVLSHDEIGEVMEDLF